MLGYYVDDISQRLAARQENDGWQVCIDLILSISEGTYPLFIQEIEATLHCLVSIQEAMDMGQSLHLPRLFSPEILGRLPSTGHGRIRRTMLTLIGMYSFGLHDKSHRPY